MKERHDPIKQTFGDIHLIPKRLLSLYRFLKENNNVAKPTEDDSFAFGGAFVAEDDSALGGCISSLDSTSFGLEFYLDVTGEHGIFK